MKKFAIYLLFFVNLGLIVYLWLSGSYSLLSSPSASGQLIAFGRLAGLFLEFFILTQLVLMGRVVFIEQLFGHDRLNRLHRWNGYFLSLFLVSHPILLIIGYAKQNHVGLIEQFLNFLKHYEDVLNALIGACLLVLVILTSLLIRKRARYETWYFIHLLTYVAIALVFGHQIKTADVSAGGALFYWYILNFTAFGLILVYRWLKPLYLFYIHRFQVKDVVMETPNLYSVHISGRKMESYKFNAGQFANLTFLQKGMWFTHPFSYSKAYDGKSLRFTVKALGDFTTKAHKLQKGTKVILDGPLGLFTKHKSKKNKFLFLAGGVGITPIVALMQELAKEKKDMVLIYSAKNYQDFAFIPEVNATSSKNYFVVSRESEALKPKFEAGHIDAEKIQRLVPDFKERAIYLCGPEHMMRGVQTALATLNVPKKDVHLERFAY